MSQSDENNVPLLGDEVESVAVGLRSWYTAAKQPSVVGHAEMLSSHLLYGYGLTENSQRWKFTDNMHRKRRREKTAQVTNRDSLKECSAMHT